MGVHKCPKELESVRNLTLLAFALTGLPLELRKLDGRNPEFEYRNLFRKVIKMICDLDNYDGETSSTLWNSDLAHAFRHPDSFALM